MPAGEKRESLAFEKRGVGDDTYGATPGDWEEQFKTTGRIRFLRGSEPVIGQRLTGTQPLLITVHNFSSTQLIMTGWRVRNLRTGETFGIRSVTPGERPGEDIDLVCSAGGLVDDD